MLARAHCQLEYELYIHAAVVTVHITFYINGNVTVKN